jgi:hypothetical protein
MRKLYEVCLPFMSWTRLIVDFTATTIIERFTDEAAAASVERCLKKLAAKKAKEQLEQREPRLPSPTFISSYLGAFRPRTSLSISFRLG